MNRAPALTPHANACLFGASLWHGTCILQWPPVLLPLVCRRRTCVQHAEELLAACLHSHDVHRGWGCVSRRLNPTSQHTTRHAAGTQSNRVIWMNERAGWGGHPHIRTPKCWLRLKGD